MKAKKLLEQLQKMEGAKKIKEQLQKLDDSAEVVLQCDATGDNYYLNIRERFDYMIELDGAS